MSPETLALLGVIVAACAVFYQARAYHLSRRDLSLKVKDLSEVVHRLEGEINERQVLDREHKRLKVESLTQHAAALNHATHLGGVHTDTFILLSHFIHGAVSDIQNILLAHNAIACGKREGREAERLQLLDAVSVFCQARLAQVALADEWDSERLVATTTGREVDTVAAAEERVRVITATMARLEGKYSDRLRSLNSDLVAARSRFLELFEGYIA